MARNNAQGRERCNVRRKREMPILKEKRENELKPRKEKNQRWKEKNKVDAKEKTTTQKERDEAFKPLP